MRPTDTRRVARRLGVYVMFMALAAVAGVVWFVATEGTGPEPDATEPGEYWLFLILAVVELEVLAAVLCVLVELGVHVRRLARWFLGR
jgi:hypothetical protein